MYILKYEEYYYYIINLKSGCRKQKQANNHWRLTITLNIGHSLYFKQVPT
jgi:hypothetical protein